MRDYRHISKSYNSSGFSKRSKISKNYQKPSRLQNLIVGIVIFAFISLVGSFIWANTASKSISSEKKQISFFQPKTINIQDLIEIKEAEQKTLQIPSDSNLSSDSKLPDFVKFENSELSILPKSGDAGDYSFKFQYSQNGDNYIKTIYIKVSQKEADFEALKKEVEAILGEQKGNYAVTVWDLKRKKGFSINGDVVKPPASISKIPYAVLTLRDIDKGENTLDEIYKIRSSAKAYKTDSLYNYKNGSEVSLDQYIKFLIQESDNTAMMHLEAFLGGNSNYNQRVRSELGLTNLFRNPHTTTANQVSIFLQNIYSQKYLSKESNDYLIDVMENTAQRFHDRIKAGVPEDTKVAHKIGNLGGVYQDAGIVYGSETDFVIVVLNENTSTASAQEIIPKITETVYEELN